MTEKDETPEEIVPTDGEPSFCLHDFKQWMENQNGQPAMIRPSGRSEDWVGARVSPKLENVKRLSQKITVEDGDLQDLSRDFRRNGGRVVSIDQHYLVIEVDSGRFAIPKFFVKKGF